MKHVLLGRTGVRVSELCFGTMTFGSPADEETSRAMFNRCLDMGINFFDCANVYAGGRSEEILGRLMKGKRDDLVITSKVFGNMSGKLNGGGLSRLDTDRLDLYFVHQMDADTPIEGNRSPPLFTRVKSL